MHTELQDERARAAAELVVELVRAFKVRRLYDPGHPQRRESEDLTAVRLGNLLAASGSIDLTIANDRLLFEEETVYEQAEGRESLAFLLHREGLRLLSFYPGLTGEELGVFLDEVAAAALADAEEEFDLVARLWGRNFTHIRYTFVETLMDEDWAPPVPEDLEQAEGKKGALVIGRDDVPLVLFEEDRQASELLRDADPTLYFLDDEDMAILQRELETEKERSLHQEALTCMRELLLQPDLGDPSAVLSAVADIQDAYLQEGSYREIVALHAIFEPEVVGERLDPGARAALDGLRDRALEPGTLDQLVARLEGDVVHDDVVAEYYRAFGRGRLALLLAHCGDVKRLCQRQPVAEALVTMAREESAEMRAAIVDPDPLVACPAAYLAGLAAQPQFLEPLARALGSADGPVRREALTAIKQIGGPRALEVVAGAVEDEDPTIRLYALRHLIAHRYAPALPRVAALLERNVGISLTERRLLHEAYGALGGDGVVDELARKLQRKGLFRKSDPEETACIMVALGATGSPYARDLVEEMAETKHPLIQRTAAEVLQSWSGAPSGARR